MHFTVFLEKKKEKKKRPKVSVLHYCNRCQDYPALHPWPRDNTLSLWSQTCYCISLRQKKKKRVKHFPLLVLTCRGVTIIKAIKNKLSEVTAADRGSLVASRLYRVFYNPTRDIKRNPDYKHYTWKLSEAIWLPDMSMAERNRDSMWLWRSSYEGCWAARSA